MSYRLEKESGDIVIDGFEQGIAPSPHKGIANIQNGNISTELGEVMASFNRTAQVTSAGTVPVSGTLTASIGDGTYVLASNVALSVGQWINVTAATVQVFKTSETVTYLAVGGGGGGGGSAAVGGASGGGGAGQFSTSTLSVGVKAYTITLGAGGAGGANTGVEGTNGGSTTVTHTSGVTVQTDVTVIGGGGGGAVAGGTVKGGISGASGGGGGTSSGTGSAGGTGTQGHNGGSGVSGFGGGGGGATSAGANASGSGAAGGAGTASSISGASVTYAGGGAGNGGTGGAGGGGNGSNGATGGAGTANTGGGGGGTSGNGFTGGAGGSGTVVISYPTGNLTATGGTITTSGGNTIHTFTSNGTFTISAINTTQNLATGSYFIDYSAASNKVKIATSYDPGGANPYLHGTSGTISFTTLGQLAKPIAKAKEVYNSASTTYYRYYILDSNGLVWVNDSGNSVGWVVTNPSTTYFGSQATPSGLAVLNGWLLVFAGEKVFAKPTANLGTAWVEITGDANSNLFSSTIPHFAYVGHQGKCYYADGNYVGSIFPDTSIQTSGANVQSLCSYTGTDTTHGTVSAVLSGSGPADPTGSTYLIPVVFFTDDFGTLPTAITAGAVYWISAYAAGTGIFQVLGASSSSTVMTTGAPVSGDTSATLSSSWTGQTFIQPVVFTNGDIRNAQFTNGSAAVTWATPLTGTSTTTLTIGGGVVDVQTGATGNQYFNTFSPTSAYAGSGGLLTTMTLSNQRLNLPSFEIAQCMTEIGNTIIIGCKGNVLYPWNQVDSTPSSIITLPESDTVSLLTVNQMAYSFTGHKGSVYITDGSVASQVIKVPDYAAGVPGSPATYIEPVFTFEDSMYLRGRIYFSILDQTSTKVGNCGGIWSFIPTQNLYIGQDTGIALRLENQNSYATYNGAATLLLAAEAQTSGNPLYWSGWWADTSGTSYGIDYSNTGTSSGFTTVIETDAIPVGTMLKKKTFEQLEYKLSAPLDSGATVSMKYRPSLTAAWSNAGRLSKDPSGLSGYFAVSFEKGQWLQLQTTITPITSTAATNTFVRLRELRIR